MPTFVPHVLVGVGITVAIWLLSNDGWPGLVIGAVLAVTLWVMLRVRPVEPGEDPAVAATGYLATAVVAVGFGYVFYRLGDENGAWWSIGFILAGLVMPVRHSLGRGPSTR